MSDDAPTTAHPFWRQYMTPPGVWQQARLGDFSLWVKRSGDEWQAGSLIEPAFAGEAALTEPCRPVAGDPPGYLVLRRWVQPGELSLLLRPSLPDRPLVVRTATPVDLLPGTECSFLITIPLWLELCALRPGGEAVTLCRLPMQTLSDTWFGTPETGELCYVLKSPASRTLDADASAGRPQQAVCALCVENRSAAELSFQRLRIETRRLGLHAGATRLWTDTLSCRWRGENQCDLVYSGLAPVLEPMLAQLAKPLEPPGHGLIERGLNPFSLLGGLAGWHNRNG